MFRRRRGTCFDSVCAKPGGLACRRLERYFIHTSGVLPLSFAHMSHSDSFRDIRRSSWKLHFERSANSEQQVCAVFQVGVWASPLMFNATRSNLALPCHLYPSTPMQVSNERLNGHQVGIVSHQNCVCECLPRRPHPNSNAQRRHLNHTPHIFCSSC